MTIEAAPITADELARLPQVEGHVELVRGVVVKMPPAGAEHGEIAGNIFFLVKARVRRQELGKVYAAETGFILSHDPDTVRAPDVAFVARERAAQQQHREGFFDGAPDLAVEVISPTDAYGDVEAKVLEYLQAGTKLVWIVEPRTRTVTAYRSLENVRVLTVEDTIDGEDVIPGLAVPVKEIFE